MRTAVIAIFMFCLGGALGVSVTDKVVEKACLDKVAEHVHSLCQRRPDWCKL